ncbi:MAG: FHIPEP family type III secretion protein, partial [bacterium]
QALSRQISNLYTEEDGYLYVVTLDPQLEDTLSQNLESSDQGNYLSLEPAQAQNIIDKIANQVQTLVQQGHLPVLLTAPMLRRPLKELTYRTLKELIALSYNELDSQIDIQVIGTVR